MSGSEFSVRGDDDVRDRLQGLRDRARDLTPVWPAVGDVVADAVKRQFASDGAEFDTPWPALSPDYMAWKVKNSYSPDTLVKTGSLRDGLTSRPMAIERYGATEAEFGTDDKVAVYHTYGTRRGLPKRPPLKRTPALAREMNGKIAGWITDGKVS